MKLSPKKHNYNFANFFIKNSKLTLIIVLVSILMGIASAIFIPKEEEPQIEVPMIDIIATKTGLTAKEIERDITEIIERAMWSIDGVEYIYSQSQQNQSLITIRFKVGYSSTKSLVAVHHKLLTIDQSLETNGRPIVKSYSIDDVPFLILAISSPNKSPLELRESMLPIVRSLYNDNRINQINLLGGQQKNIMIKINYLKIQEKSITLTAIKEALNNNQIILSTSKNHGGDNLYNIEIGNRYKAIEDIKNVAIGSYEGKIIRIKDIAEVIEGASTIQKISSLYTKDFENQNALALSFSKKPGSNATILSEQIIEKTKQLLKNTDLKIDTMRDYGKTAQDKSSELILHLFMATFLVSLLIAVFMGFRCALIIGIAIPVTLSLTLISFHFLGFTLNRVTLFALVFAIGILVDDAIVVVENIERHLKNDRNSPMINTILTAISEVAGSTILATLAVIFAILPMSFVQGMMGPYMKPIPIGSSFAMTFSLLIAFSIIPWATLKILKPKSNNHQASQISKFDQFYQKIIHYFLDNSWRSLGFILLVMFLLISSISLIYFKKVKVKMLPFDNKNEFQIILDFPPRTNLLNNHQLTKDLAKKLINDPNIEKIQIFSGEPAPFSFSGMVKHTYLRNQDYMSDLQIVLKDKHQRKNSSHEIINNIRPILKEFSSQNQAVIKVLEIPPGPPVMATMIAEIYNDDSQTRNIATRQIMKIFENEPSFVDIDSSLRPQRPIIFNQFDFINGGKYLITANQIAQTGEILFKDNKIGSFINENYPEELPINLLFSDKIRQENNNINDLKIYSPKSGIIDAKDSLEQFIEKENPVLYRKNLMPVNYVFSELSGEEEAPFYGIQKLKKHLDNFATRFINLPNDLKTTIIKWDGEIFITLEVFRDLGIAFAVAILAIYILILVKFNSFSVPIIVMAPIPISLIGVIFGHYLTNSYFTATSMIGFMAGAGIIVRNSIILIDFIEQQILKGEKLKDAVIIAGTLRFRPMLLTALAVIFGSLVMLSDPIFNGFAISLIFGEISATILSRFVIPIIYYFIVGNRRKKALSIA